MRQLAQTDAPASSASVGGGGIPGAGAGSASNLTVPSSNKKARSSISELGMMSMSGGSFLDTPDRDHGITSPEVVHTPSATSSAMITSPLAGEKKMAPLVFLEVFHKFKK